MTTPNLEIYNPNEMLVQCMNDKDIFNQFLAMACQTLPSYKEELLTAIESEDVDVIGQKAHKLKSFTGNIKLSQLNQLLVGIEHDARQNNLANIKAVFEELKIAFTCAETALNNELTNK